MRGFSSLCVPPANSTDTESNLQEKSEQDCNAPRSRHKTHTTHISAGYHVSERGAERLDTTSVLCCPKSMTLVNLKRFLKVYRAYHIIQSASVSIFVFVRVDVGIHIRKQRTIQVQAERSHQKCEPQQRKGSRYGTTFACCGAGIWIWMFTIYSEAVANRARNRNCPLLMSGVRRESQHAAHLAPIGHSGCLHCCELNLQPYPMSENGDNVNASSAVKKQEIDGTSSEIPRVARGERRVARQETEALSADSVEPTAQTTAGARAQNPRSGTGRPRAQWRCVQACRYSPKPLELYQS